MDGAAITKLVERARRLAEDDGDRRLAEALLDRRPLRSQCAALFLVADPLQRVEILLAAQRAQIGQPPGLLSRSRKLSSTTLSARLSRAIQIISCPRSRRPLIATRRWRDASSTIPRANRLPSRMAALGASGDVLVRVLIANDLEAGETLSTHPCACAAERRPRPQRGDDRDRRALRPRFSAMPLKSSGRASSSFARARRSRGFAPFGSAATQGRGLRLRRQPRKLRAVGAKKPSAMRMAPTTPSPTLIQISAPISVMIAADASTIAIWVRPLPSS